MFADQLKKRSKLIDGEGFKNIEDDLLVSVSSPEKNGIGLYLLSNTKIFAVEEMPCTGITMSDEALFVSKAFADHLRLFKIAAESRKEIVDTSFGDVHDIKFFDGKIYIVSTGTNEVVSISADFDGKIIDRWRFSGCGESWHLNCLDVWNDRLVVSAFGEFGYYREYQRQDKRGRGIVVDVATKEIVWNGLSTPHNPRLDKSGRRLICDSYTSRVLLETADRKSSEISFAGAFTRGLAVGNKHLYVGLSALRRGGKINTTINCATVSLVDPQTLEQVDSVALPASEIYDILVI